MKTLILRSYNVDAMNQCNYLMYKIIRTIRNFTVAIDILSNMPWFSIVLKM